MAPDGHYLGVDFGTSTIYITKWDPIAKEAKPVENITRQHGSSPFIDSVIYYESRKNQVLGGSAFNRGLLDPFNAVAGVKRKIGDDNWTTPIACYGDELSAEDIAADMFRVLKIRIEEIYGGEPIAGAVISVPFAFHSKERARIKHAAERAGFTVMKLIEEPVAAAICFGLLERAEIPQSSEKVLIFDLGGGTFDVTIFELSSASNGERCIEVINTAGHKQLGGIDVDKMLVHQFERQLGYEIALLPEEKMRRQDLFHLLKVSQEFKENLTRYGEADAFCAELSEGRVLDMDIDLQTFNNWLRGNGFINKIREILENTLVEVDLEPEDIDRVVLVGGASNIPLVQKELIKFFDKPGESIIDPAEMVGRGAGIYCGSLIEKHLSFEIITKLSHAIGIKVNRKFERLIPRNSIYELFSETKYFPVESHVDNRVRIEVFQGNSMDIDECTIIGKIETDMAQILQNEIGIQLGTDKNGIVNYRLFNQNNETPFNQGEL